MTEPPTAAILIGQCADRVFGLTGADRLRLGLARLGVAALEDAGGQPPAPKVTPAGAAPAGASIVLVRVDHVYDERVLAGLVTTPDVVLTTPGAGGPVPVAAHVAAGRVEALRALLARGQLHEEPPGLRVVQPAALAASHQPDLRKREAPYVMAIRPQALPAIERRMFAGAYKGATDLVTKYVWPWPARRATKWAAVHHIAPNLITSLSLLCVVAAFFLFIAGAFLPGLAAAWLMTFLDTVDGKLARLTFTSSKWGTVFDHGIDLVHPPFWYVAWASGLGRVPHHALGGHLDLLLAVIVAGYVLGRLQEGAFLALFGIEIHVWRPLDTWFRLITARRNPNLLLLTVATVLGRPDLGFAAVAAWTAISFLFHCVRIVQACKTRRSTAVRSWLAQEGAR